jgi:hypothetical protein
VDPRSRCQCPCLRTSLGDNLRAINPQRPAIVHQHLAVDDRRPDVTAASRVYDRRVGVGTRRKMRPIAIDDDQIRALAWFD